MIKEMRLDFPDYPASEQEKDARSARFRQVYLLKVDGEWGHFTLTNHQPDIDFYGEKTLTEVYYKIKESYPRHHIQVIRNKGLENYLRDKKPQTHQRAINKINATQLMINFGKEY